MWITMIRTMLRMYQVLYMSMYLKSAVVGSFDLTELRKAEEQNVRIIAREETTTNWVEIGDDLQGRGE